MEMINQLRTLNRLFPHATEYAVTQEQVEGYVMEVTGARPHSPTTSTVARSWERESLPNGVIATKTNIRFRGVRLVIVERAR